jgi:UDPglucose 6-dehydrogenase
VAFINEIATICDSVHAEIGEVRRGIGTDHRIGFEFLTPGFGYGGSCFPKNVKALENIARVNGVNLPLIAAIDASNSRQKQFLENKIREHFNGELQGQTIALWGLAFKAGTDDIRESPALNIIEGLLNKGANVRVHDPVAMSNVHRLYGNALTYCKSPMEAIHNAHALVVMTDWEDYRGFEPADILALMVRPTIFDGRYLFNSSKMQQAGIDYHAIGDGIPLKSANMLASFSPNGIL